MISFIQGLKNKTELATKKNIEKHILNIKSQCSHEADRGKNELIYKTEDLLNEEVIEYFKKEGLTVRKGRIAKEPLYPDNSVLSNIIQVYKIQYHFSW